MAFQSCYIHFARGSIENKLLNSIFKKEFLERISEFETKIFPIAVVFINEMKIDGEKKGFPQAVPKSTFHDTMKF